MRVLVACEYSNTVRDAFLRLGHDAYSCDLLRADHPNPNWRRHTVGDVRPLLKEPWDLVIAHPPCTYLCNSGVHWLHKREGRREQMVDGAIFFLECFAANAPRVAVENPIMHKYARELIRFQPTQTIQPWQFGHPVSKSTCLWLRGLPKLVPTDIVECREKYVCKELGGGDGKERSKTFFGIAKAMAEQWGGA